jgi:hypothetical protein
MENVLGETNFEKLFTPQETSERIQYPCSQFNVLQDLKEHFDDNFNLHIVEKNTRRKKFRLNKKTLL